METDFSEFSYGYAAIREAEAAVAEAYRLAGAPVLPSLLLEAHGGYDVEVRTTVEYALFLQFKRPTYIKRSHPASPTWPHVNAPHYRFAIDTSHHQYQLLLDLEAQITTGARQGDVLYAAAQFHTQADFDNAYLNGEVLSRSVLEPPSEFPNDGLIHHHVTAGDTGATSVLSTPRAPTKQVRWPSLVDSIGTRAANARQNRGERIRLEELEQVLLAITSSATHVGDRDLDAPVSHRIDRLATSIGCGLVLFGLDPAAELRPDHGPESTQPTRE